MAACPADALFIAAPANANNLDSVEAKVVQMRRAGRVEKATATLKT
jgi:hypothetical protein